VEWKSNILSAVSRLAEPGIDVVLLDLGMQELGVDGTLPAIVSVVGKTIPIVIPTSDDSTVSQEITRLQGAANYFIKQRTLSVELRQGLYEAVAIFDVPSPRTSLTSPVTERSEKDIYECVVSLTTTLRSHSPQGGPMRDSTGSESDLRCMTTTSR
jgi:CheY-like chemotaxis protein